MGSTLERQMMLEGPVCGVCVCVWSVKDFRILFLIIFMNFWEKKGHCPNIMLVKLIHTTVAGVDWWSFLQPPSHWSSLRHVCSTSTHWRNSLGVNKTKHSGCVSPYYLFWGYGREIRWKRLAPGGWLDMYRLPTVVLTEADRVFADWPDCLKNE